MYIIRAFLHASILYLRLIANKNWRLKFSSAASKAIYVFPCYIFQRLFLKKMKGLNLSFILYRRLSERCKGVVFFVLYCAFHRRCGLFLQTYCKTVVWTEKPPPLLSIHKINPITTSQHNTPAYSPEILIIEHFPETEFLDVIGTKVSRVFLLAIYSHLH